MFRTYQKKITTQNIDKNMATLIGDELPALRYCEYCITASELWVAVLSVFVQNPPFFYCDGWVFFNFSNEL